MPSIYERRFAMLGCFAASSIAAMPVSVFPSMQRTHP
jgi:hypothetical protein